MQLSVSNTDRKGENSSALLFRRHGGNDWEAETSHVMQMAYVDSEGIDRARGTPGLRIYKSESRTSLESSSQLRGSFEARYDLQQARLYATQTKDEMNQLNGAYTRKD